MDINRAIDTLVTCWASAVENYKWQSVSRWDPLIAHHRSEALPCLIRLFRHGSSQVRRMAAIKVSELDERNDHDQAISTLLDDPQSEVRLAAAVCLAKRNTAAFKILLATATDSNSLPWVRAEAVKSLGRAGNPLAIPPLVELLLENNWDIQNQAGCALSYIGQPAVNPLASMLQNPAISPAARCSACVSLGQIGDAHALPPLLNCKDDPDPKLRRLVAWALGKLPRDERSVRALVNMCLHDEIEVQDVALESLGKLRAGAASSLVKTSLLSGNAKSRRVAIKSVMEIGLVQECVPMLCEVMQSDEDDFCRFDAAVALTKMDDVEILKMVIEFRDKVRKLFYGKMRKQMLRQLDAALHRRPTTA